jgi:hypothetical protein
MSFKLSPKVTLEKGDQVRVSGGPYYVTQDGDKLNMGEKGVGKFMEASANGEAIWVLFPQYGAPRFVYIGPEKVSDLTGMIYKAHKVRKLRKK